MKMLLRGIAASPGIGIGHALVYRAVNLNSLERDVGDLEDEYRRYRNAVERFCTLREEKAAQLKAVGAETRAAILLAQAEMIKDPYLAGQVEGRIASYRSAEAALDEVCGSVVRQFLRAENELTRERASDIRDVRDGVLRQLLGVPEVDFSNMEPDTILVADDLTPSAMTALDPSIVAGIVLCRGGRASHSAILARAMGIPTVVGAIDALAWVVNGETLVVDGIQGEAYLEPDTAEMARMQEYQERYRKNRESLRAFVRKQARTADGDIVQLMATVGSESEGFLADEDGCDGIGLLRSEFLYLDRPSLPKEEEQFQVYRRFAQRKAGGPVVIRTLDAGGDKRMPGLSWDWEKNPVLGCRAVRLSLAYPDISKVQIRALLRAGAYGDVRILLPLVTGLDEVRGFKRLVEECQAELEERGEPFRAGLPLGVMIETVAAALTVDRFAQEVDFFSIGTNDLTQYTLAVDRDNARVAHLYSYYDPALLRLLKWVVRRVQEAGKPVCLCGQAPADPLFVPLLLGLGLDCFSVQPMSLLAARGSISLWTKEEGRRILEHALGLVTEAEVHTLLENCVRRI